MKIRILILGQRGQLGSEIYKNLKLNRTLKIFSLNKKEYFKSKIQTLSLLKRFNVHYVINCIGFTNVDDAEKQKSKAMFSNYKLVKYLLIYCKKNNVTLIHFSTDFVFKGREKKIKKENSKASPANYYGYTKLLADKEIVNSQNKYFIFRICWLVSKKGSNYNESRFTATN